MDALEDFSFFLRDRDGTFQYPYYEAIRRGPRVLREPDFGVHMVARHDDLVAVSRDTQTFATSPVAVAGPLLAQTLASMSPVEREQMGEMLRANDRLLHNEPPSHTRFRALLSGLVMKWFGQLEPMVRSHVEELIDGFIAAGEVEFVERFSNALPLRVITTVLGVPDEDRELFLDRTNEQVGTVESLRALRRGEAPAPPEMTGPGTEYFRPLLEERRAHPRDDLPSKLVHARFPDTGEPLSDDDCLAIIGLVLGAGQGTSAKLFTQGAAMLAREPEWGDWLRQDPRRTPKFVHEVLRVETPVQGMFRMARVDTHVGGVAVPAGSTLMLLYASANRDEEVFPEPERFDPTRKNVNSQVAFGHGPHLCLGMALAQLEARVSFERLLTRLRTLRLAERNTFPWYQSTMLHGLAELHLTFEAA